MPRITPVHWKILECIFLLTGFAFSRQEGDHRVYVKPGVLRPVVIPTKRALDVMIIQSNMRTARMDRDTYFRLLAECQ